VNLRDQLNLRDQVNLRHDVNQAQPHQKAVAMIA
jgi:hypothetical protein